MRPSIYRMRASIRPVTLLTIPMTALALLVVGGICCSAPAGSVVVVTQQDRSVNGWVWIGSCPQQSQNIVAPDAAPFDATLSLDPDCAFGDSTSNSAQQSEILDNEFTAVGEGHLYGFTPQGNVIHGSARSRYDVSFDLAESRNFTLAGTIAAARTGTNLGGGHFVITSVLLSGPAGTVYSRTLQPGLNTSLGEDVDAEGTLEPGSYLISVNAQTYLDQSFNNNWVQGDVSFDITLRIVRIGDITGDGAVGVPDLLEVINQWGPCDAPPAECHADIVPPSGDGTVGVPEVLLVINNWG